MTDKNGNTAEGYSGPATVFEAWAAVMGEVQAVEKLEKNAQGGRFMFRGIDATINAVGPALRKYSVSVTPDAVEISGYDYVTKGGTAMRNSTVHVRFTVRGPAGDEFSGSTWGEAADAGDKSVSKAHSVAYRTFLLQALCIPTNDRDPDADSHERQAGSPADDARKVLMETMTSGGFDPQEAVDKFAADGHGELRDTVDVAAIRKLVDHYQTLKTGGAA